MRSEVFPGQRKNEKVVLLLRRHWIIIAKHVMRVALFMIVPVLVLGFLFELGWTIELNGPVYVLAIMTLSFYYMFIWLFFYHEFMDYHLDVWIVTTERIISIEQDGLFKHIASEHPIEKVQDVTAELKGKRQTFMNYGFVHVQTAAESQRFIFEEVPNPKEVARIVMEVHDMVAKAKQGQMVERPVNVLEISRDKSDVINA